MRLLPLLATLLCLASLAPAQDQPAYKSDPRFIASVAEGKTLLAKRQFAFAIDAFKKANKIAAGKDAAVLNSLYNLQLGTRDYKGALNTTNALQELTVTPRERAKVEIERGSVFFSQAGDKNKPDLLNAADSALKAAMADDPKNPTAHYLDGKVLARLNQLDAAGAQFKECLDCMSPKDPSYVRTQHFAANPALATAKMAPAFTVTALDGTRFNLDEMGGRVVLIDFWAT